MLHEEKDDHMLAIIAWAIGQIGKHTPEHAKAVAVANILPKLLAVSENFLHIIPTPRSIFGLRVTFSYTSIQTARRISK